MLSDTDLQLWWLALVLAAYRGLETIYLDEINLMKW